MRASSRRGSYRPFLVVVTAATVLSLGVFGLETLTTATPPAVAADAPAKVTERPDRASAWLAASQQDSRVEVANERSETSSTWVNPDGTLTTEQFAGIVRVRQGDGSFKDVDFTLAAGANGRFSPAVSPYPVSIAAGGGAEDAYQPLVTLGTGPDAVSWLWKGVLPTPTVIGDTATFAGVLPNVDLVVQATGSGFEQSFIVNRRPDGPLALPLPVKTGAGVNLADGTPGEVRFVSATGKVLGESNQPLMWDAKTEPGSDQPLAVLPVTADLVPAGSTSTSIDLVPAAEPTAGNATTSGPTPTTSPAASANPTESATASPVPADGSVPAGEGLPTTNAELTHALDGVPANADTLVLAPSPEFLADPATQYPVTVDPTVSWGPTFDTYVQSGLTSDQSGSTSLQIGKTTTQPVARTFLNFDMSAMAGKEIFSATLGLWESYGTTCVGQQWDVWHTGPANTSTRWTAQPTWYSKWSDSTETLGYSGSCAAGRVHADVTNLVQSFATAGSGAVGIGLQGHDETSTFSRKTFISADSATQKPYLQITYGSKPYKPGTPQVVPVTSSGSANWTTTTTPLLKAKVDDIDGGNVRAHFQVWYGPTIKWDGYSSYVAGGKYASATVPAGLLFTNRAYVVRVYANDGTSDSAAFTDGTAFSIDDTAPPAPTVSCTNFSSGVWTASGTASTCSVSSTDAGAGPSGTGAFAWSLDAPDDLTNQAPATTSTGSIALANLTQGWHTLTVKSVDKSGRTSDTATSYSFGVGPAGFDDLDAGVSTPESISLATSAIPSAGTIEYQYLNKSEAWTTIPAAELGSFANPHTFPAPTSSNQVTGAVRWNLLATATRENVLFDQVFQVRACINGTVTCTISYPITLDRVGNGGARASAGPGSVSMVTGNLSLSASDVDIVGARSGLSVSRNYNSMTADADSVFGAGWATSLQSAPNSDYSKIVDTGSTLLLYTGDKTPLGFTVNGNTITPGQEAAGLRLVKSGDGALTMYSLTDKGGTTVVFEWSGTGTFVNPPTKSSPNTFVQKFASTPTEGMTGIKNDSEGRVLRAAASLPNASADPINTCPVDGNQNPTLTWAPGCRDLKFSYDANHHITKITYRYAGTTVTAAASVGSVDVACYTYATFAQNPAPPNPIQRLSTSWDPRDRFGGTTAPSCADAPVLPVTYHYDTSGRLDGLTPRGRQFGRSPMGVATSWRRWPAPIRAERRKRRPSPMAPPLVRRAAAMTPTLT